jgi:hypothetical protein
MEVIQKQSVNHDVRATRGRNCSYRSVLVVFRAQNLRNVNVYRRLCPSVCPGASSPKVLTGFRRNKVLAM